MTKVHVSDQHAANSVTSKSEFADSSVPVMQTALGHVGFEKLSMRVRSGQGVTVRELPVTGLLVLRARDDKASLEKAMQAQFGLALPPTLSSSCIDYQANGTLCLRWIAPDEWLLSCSAESAFAIETGLREKLNGASVAIVNVSGGFTFIELMGPHVINVLKKSTAYDTHPDNFSKGKVVNTVFAKAQVTMRCIGPEHVELIVRRSFADYVWHWIQVAAAEYGLSISV